MTDQPRRLERNPDNKMIAGVASGVADFFGIDPTIVRVLWALTILFGGLGAIVYIILWIVMPEPGTDSTVAHEIRDRMTEAPTSTDPLPPKDGETDTDNGPTAPEQGGGSQTPSNPSADGSSESDANTTD